MFLQPSLRNYCDVFMLVHSYEKANDIFPVQLGCTGSARGNKIHDKSVSGSKQRNLRLFNSYQVLIISHEFITPLQF